MAAVLGGGWHANESDNRPFVWAVLGSLTFHLALILALPLLIASRLSHPTPPPITARLANPKPLEPAMSAAFSAPMTKIELPVQPRMRPPEPRPAPVAKAVPRPVPAPPAPVLSVQSAQQGAEAAFVASAVPASPPAAPPAAVAAKAQQLPSAPAATEAGTLRQYRLEIIDLARRYKKYPRAAIDNNWMGTVEVRMVIGTDGAIASLAVKSSAGYAVLDQEALAMIRSAQSRATIPPALRGREITVEVPVIFNLKDE